MNIDSLCDDLKDKIKETEKVIIVPHNNADFDAIGSAIGVSLISKYFERPEYIIVNDPVYALDPGVRLIVDENKKDFNIINKERYRSMAKSGDLFVLTDVNKSRLICLPDMIKKPEKTIIIDHHTTDEDTVLSNHKYIDTKYSSASEIVVSLLDTLGIEITSKVADYLYAGIYLDTAKLTKNCTADTMRSIAKLLESGANINKVNSFFKEDFYSDRKVQNLVNSAQMTNCMIALIVATDDIEYSKEEIAKAADYALKYGVDAAFAMGRIDDEIVSISGRSTERIDIGSIMEELGGGGNPYSGATKLKNISVEEAGKKLRKVLKPSYFIGD